MLIFVVFEFLPRNRLAAMKVCQVTQLIFTLFSGFWDEMPSDDKEPLDDANLNHALLHFFGFCDMLESSTI